MFRPDLYAPGVTQRNVVRTGGRGAGWSGWGWAQSRAFLSLRQTGWMGRNMTERDVYHAGVAPASISIELGKSYQVLYVRKTLSFMQV